MSKHWNPTKPTVPLEGPAPRPSRIRRDPVRISEARSPVRAAPVSDERHLWGGIAGITLFAAAIVAAVIGISVATFSRADPGALAAEGRFGQCYNASGPNCVLDGGTIYVQRERVEIAGMDAPRIVEARCEAERSRGIAAAVALANLLNSGPVSIGPVMVDETGRAARKVAVGGRNLAFAMIGLDLAHPAGSKRSWC